MFICSICSDELESTNDRIVASPCGHVFHAKCLYGWIDENPACYRCGTDLVRGQVITLYLSPVEIDLPTLKKEYDLSQDQVKQLEDEVSMSLKEINDLESTRETLFNCKTKLGKINSCLKFKLQQFFYLQQLISCSEVDFQLMLQTITNQPHALWKMVFFCTLLREQLLIVSNLESQVSPQEKSLVLHEELNENLLKSQLLKFERENGLIFRNQFDTFSNILYMNDVTKYLIDALKDLGVSKDVQFDDVQIEDWIETRFHFIHKVATISKKN